jgi:hypothetical protein
MTNNNGSMLFGIRIGGNPEKTGELKTLAIELDTARRHDELINI